MMVPEINVPVTMVPKPEMVNTRSMGNLGMLFTSLSSTSFFTMFRMTSFSSSMPSPVAADTRTMGACSIMVP